MRIFNFLCYRGPLFLLMSALPFQSNPSNRNLLSSNWTGTMGESRMSTQEPLDPLGINPIQAYLQTIAWSQGTPAERWRQPPDLDQLRTVGELLLGKKNFKSAGIAVLPTYRIPQLGKGAWKEVATCHSQLRVWTPGERPSFTLHTPTEEYQNLPTASTVHICNSRNWK